MKPTIKNNRDLDDINKIMEIINDKRIVVNAVQ